MICFREAEVFPVIARIIREKSADGSGFVSHQAIASRLLEDREAKVLVAQAHQQQEGDQSQEWIASNMVAWFSQRITVSRSDWVEAFERVKVDGTWAYKPADGSSDNETN